MNKQIKYNKFLPNFMRKLVSQKKHLRSTLLSLLTSFLALQILLGYAALAASSQHYAIGSEATLSYATCLEQIAEHMREEGPEEVLSQIQQQAQTLFDDTYINLSSFMQNNAEVLLADASLQDAGTAAFLGGKLPPKMLPTAQDAVAMQCASTKETHPKQAQQKEGGWIGILMVISYVLGLFSEE